MNQLEILKEACLLKGITVKDLVKELDFPSYPSFMSGMYQGNVSRKRKLKVARHLGLGIDEDTDDWYFINEADEEKLEKLTNLEIYKIACLRKGVSSKKVIEDLGFTNYASFMDGFYKGTMSYKRRVLVANYLDLGLDENDDFYLK